MQYKQILFSSSARQDFVVIVWLQGMLCALWAPQRLRGMAASQTLQQALWACQQINLGIHSWVFSSP